MAAPRSIRHEEGPWRGCTGQSSLSETQQLLNKEKKKTQSAIELLVTVQNSAAHDFQLETLTESLGHVLG